MWSVELHLLVYILSIIQPDPQPDSLAQDIHSLPKLCPTAPTAC